MDYNDMRFAAISEVLQNIDNRLAGLTNLLVQRGYIAEDELASRTARETAIMDQYIAEAKDQLESNLRAALAKGFDDE